MLLDGLLDLGDVLIEVFGSPLQLDHVFLESLDQLAVVLLLEA